jgi:predicted regulator of Ras-like GTPase activity (Roadblock/LC7/MglB family)
MNSQKKLHDRPLVFDQKHTVLIDRCLMRLADHIASPLVMLADVSGRLILYRGRLSSTQSTGLAALAAGSYAAGEEIGNFLGLSKDNFQSQLLEGGLANLYTMKIGEELLLIIAFTNSTTLGMVRVFGHRTREEILVWVDRAAKEREVAADEETVEDGFDEALKKQLDELFTEDIGL